MAKTHKRRGKITTSIRNRILSGILLLLPFAVTFLVIRWLFYFMFKYLKPLVVKMLEHGRQIHWIGVVNPLVQTVVITCLTIFILLFFLYLVGSVGRWVIVRRFVEAGENMLMKIPLVRTIYSATQQVVKAVSLPGKESFKSVALVEFPRPGFRSIGFITGYINDARGKKYCKVFIPTAPNPTTGFFQIIPADQIAETNLSVEEAFSMIISGGLVMPKDFQVPMISRSPDHVEVG